MGPTDLEQELFDSVFRNDAQSVRKICRAHPEIVKDYMPDPDGDQNSKLKEAWTCFASSQGWEALEALLDAGFNINAVNMPEGSPALALAVSKGDLEMVRRLLERGADPNVERPVVRAMNRDLKEKQLPLVRMLVEHGLDVNKIYDLYGDAEKGFTALDWAADEEIADFLRKRGAKLAKDLRKMPVAPAVASQRKEVLDHFAKHFGPVADRALIEIVPGGIPIAVHCIRPSGNRKHYTLFTTGLSERPMPTPEGKEEFAFAELFIQLPGDWKIGALDDPNWSWPSHWLRKIGQFPYDHSTWLGGPLTVIANDDPPKPLSPNTKMTCLLLMVDGSLQRRDGKKVQLFRITPLYTEERDLELRDGAAALMRTLDRHSVPFIVDVKRPNTL